MADIKLFDRWSMEGIEVQDLGLKNYINLRPVVVPRSRGKHAKKQFHKSNLNIVERLMNHLFVSGHRGKKHLFTSQQCTGKATTNWNIIKGTLEIMEEKTKKNPVEVLVKAVENAALREEVTSFQMGGIMARKSVITSPQRRVDLALRHITQAAYHKSHGNPKGIAVCLADELLACYANDAAASSAVRERERLEREASGAR